MNECAGTLRDHGKHCMRWARDGARATPFRLLRAAINMPPPFVELGDPVRASLLGLLRGAARTLQRERLAAGDQVRDPQEQVQAARSREAELFASLTNIASRC